jgi:hypothetical protein
MAMAVLLAARLLYSKAPIPDFVTHLPFSSS